MNSEFPEHDLNRRLDRAVPPHSRATGPAADDPLVQTAQRVAQGPDVALSDAAFDRIEARLQAHMDTVGMPVHPVADTGASSPRQWRLLPRLVFRLAAAMLIVVFGFASLNRASASSLPGDQLYPVKRAIESVRLALVNTEGEADLRLSLAERRADEFETRLAQNRVYPEVLESAQYELNRSLDLLANGHGDWMTAGVQLQDLTLRTTDLLEQALPAASVSDQVHLENLAVTTSQLQQRVNTLAPPPLRPEPTATPTATPTNTPTATASPTDTPTATVSATPSATPSATSTPSPSATATTTLTPRKSATPTPTRISTQRGTGESGNPTVTPQGGSGQEQPGGNDSSGSEDGQGQDIPPDNSGGAGGSDNSGGSGGSSGSGDSGSSGGSGGGK